MTDDAPIPDYRVLSTQLDAAGVEASAAEVQGMLSGVLVLPDAAEVDWLALLPAAEPLVAEQIGSDLSQSLLDLYRLTGHQLSDREFGYRLFLPDPEQGMQQRIEAVADWCRGFLLGISSTGLSVVNCSDVVREVLSDIVEMSSVEASGADDAEEERALLEVEEYLRVAVQLLKEELQQTNDS